MPRRVPDVKATGIGRVAAVVVAVALGGGCLPVDAPNDLQFTFVNETDVTLVFWESDEYMRGAFEPGESGSVSLGHSRQYCTDDVRARTEDGTLEAHDPEICHGDTWVVGEESLGPVSAG